MNKALMRILFLLTLFINCGILFCQEDVFYPITDEIQQLTGLQDSIPSSACSICSECDNASTTFSLPFKELPFVLISISIFILLFVKNYRKQILFWSIGIVLFVGLVINMAQTSTTVTDNQIHSELLQKEPPKIPDDIKAAAIEDQNAASVDSVTNDDEFEAFVDVSDLDEFSSFDKKEELPEEGLSEGELKNIVRTSVALLATLLAGLLFRYRKLRKARYLFLISSVIYFGFYSGACPCMISSFQNQILLLLGESVKWVNLIWISGLLILTVFFGKIWCGWICHLGAFQEFLFRPELSGKLLKNSTQKVIKVIQGSAFIALIVQLIITRSNLYIKIDPFKVAYNLFSSTITGYVLLAILILSSLFIYRPFCRAFCPVGLVMGWITKIPGASKLSVNKDCKSCNRCKKTCTYQAIKTEKQSYSVINEECIRCGNCIDACNFNAIK